MTAQVANDLRAAAEVLRRDGWTQGSYKRAGCFCVIGATVTVITDGGTADPANLRDDSTWRRYSAAWDALHAVIRVSPASFNDRPGRSADEVIAALEAAAQAAEAKA